jgi:hypothetical protein
VTQGRVLENSDLCTLEDVCKNWFQALFQNIVSFYEVWHYNQLQPLVPQFCGLIGLVYQKQ